MRFRLRFFVLGFLALTLSFSGSAAAQEPVGERREIAVSVVDQDGNFVEGLTAANFRGEFRGQPVSIDNAVVQGGLKHIAAFVDVSGSSNRQWARAWTAIEDMIVWLPPPHQVVIFTFDENVVVHGTAPAGWEPGQARAALVELQKRVGKPKGKTAFYDALVAASGIRIAGRPPGALYVISDGVDTTSKAKAEFVAGYLAEREVRLFFLLMPYAPSEDERLARRARSTAKELVESTGGFLFDFSRQWPGGDDPFKSIRPFYRSMVRSYLLSVTLPARVDKPRKWKLEVVDENGKKLKKVTVAHPGLLVPLPDPADK